MYLVWSISYLSRECNGFSGEDRRIFVPQRSFIRDLTQKTTKKGLTAPLGLWYSNPTCEKGLFCRAHVYGVCARTPPPLEDTGRQRPDPTVASDTGIVSLRRWIRPAG